MTDTFYFGGHPIARLSAGQWTDLIYGPNGLIAEVPGTENATPVYRLTDHLGNAVGETDANGTLSNPMDYAPFGQVFWGSTSDPYLFTGKERDSESGLDYFGARYYASNVGRWISADWAQKPEPVPYSKLDDPQSLNLYEYVGNNPLSKADADGHQWPDCSTCQKVMNWLSSSHSASGNGSMSAAQQTERSGGLSATASVGATQGSASASYGKTTGVSASASTSLASTTINEGTHSTTQMTGVGLEAHAGAGLSVGGSGGVGVNASAGAGANVLSASQTETVSIGGITITATATGNAGIGANASFSLGTNGVSTSAGVTPGFGGAISLGVSWNGISGSGGKSVQGTIDQTKVITNKPEIKSQP